MHLVIVLVAGKIAVVGAVGAADMRAEPVVAAAKIGLGKIPAGVFNIQIPFAFFYKYGNIPMRQIPADVVVIIPASGRINLQRKITAATAGAFPARLLLG